MHSSQTLCTAPEMNAAGKTCKVSVLRVDREANSASFAVRCSAT